MNTIQIGTFYCVLSTVAHAASLTAVAGSGLFMKPWNGALLFGIFLCITGVVMRLATPIVQMDAKPLGTT